MRHLSAVMALSFMATSAFAAIVVDFVDHNNYTTKSEKLEDDQDSWSSWTKENGALKTTIKGDKFSSAIVVPLEITSRLLLQLCLSSNLFVMKAA